MFAMTDKNTLGYFSLEELGRAFRAERRALGRMITDRHIDFDQIGDLFDED